MKKLPSLFLLFSILSLPIFAQKIKSHIGTSAANPMKPALTGQSETLVQSSVKNDFLAIPKWVNDLPVFNTYISYPKTLVVNAKPEVRIWTWKMDNGNMGFLEEIAGEMSAKYTFSSEPRVYGTESSAIDFQVRIPQSTMASGKVAVVLVNAKTMFEPYCGVDYNATVRAMYDRVIYKDGIAYPCIIYDAYDPHGGYGVHCVAIPK
ncbi:MAG: hypothetical protein ACKVTZ_01695 [Bacteroidia bacterium]